MTLTPAKSQMNAKASDRYPATHSLPYLTHSCLLLRDSAQVPFIYHCLMSLAAFRTLPPKL